ncbi:corrinoid protein [Sporomusa acidovorans]|uniref:Methionine synthase n=1 Tax=Sporomusa acidovorans (strain ATCC 49682 / DSM 3132 / Mol) TaxID=1123286 RepID=A0ABZ3J4S8_SPOA4|nr:corrinoid protein [Sporomusa acidovorans]OZC23528.1 methionine synthase [Sporomusa acidovorans DSM 3132]SDF47270.1 5-methyltetrahydrofolate--homocysteine methyltransferase [Sporomusa acidovorans]
MSNFDKLAEAVYQGDDSAVKTITQGMIESGVNPMEIVSKGLLAGMDIVAPKFKSGEMFIPEVMMSAQALSAGLNIVKPLLSAEDSANMSTFVMGTVKGDLHDIGKNLVVMLLESGGFNVVDLGVDVAPETFVAAIKQHKPQIVGMCALLTTTMMAMQDTIDAINAAGLRDKVKVLVGGAPLYPEFADKIGADGYCVDAVTCKEMAAKMVVNK